ncbi:MAG: flavodoxin family protein [Methanomicrobiales archaeon]|nr:flavodoxin family protein [Methanomicrobiales archaeon]
MKVIAFNGSARKDGNTARLVRYVLQELEQEGIGTEMVQFAGKRIRGCTACMKCRENLDGRCIIRNDIVNSCIEKMAASDGIILASPTYFSDVSAEMKAFIDRSGMVARVNGDLFRRKVGAAVVAVRRAGGMHAFDTINHFFLIGQMIVVGSTYWNIGIGWKPGDVERDEEGIRTMQSLGQNIAWILKRLKAD